MNGPGHNASCVPPAVASVRTPQNYTFLPQVRYVLHTCVELPWAQGLQCPASLRFFDVYDGALTTVHRAGLAVRTDDQTLLRLHAALP